MTADVEGAFQVHGDDRVPFGLTHVEDHAVAQNAGNVDHDVNPTEFVDGLLDHAGRMLVIGDVAIVR